METTKLITNEQKLLIEQAWKYVNASKEPYKAVAIYRQLQVSFLQTSNFEKYLDVLIEEAKAWKICSNFNLISETDAINTFNALLNLFELEAQRKNFTPLPHQLFEMGHMQISFAKKYKEGIAKLVEFKKTGNPELAQQIEIDGFIGYGEYMSGNKDLGLSILKKCISDFEKIDLETPEFKGVKVNLIKYTGVLLRLGGILENKKEALEIANKALEISKTNNLSAREEQAKQLVNNLNK